MSDPRVRLMALGATENEADRTIEAVKASATAMEMQLSQAFGALAASMEAVAEVFIDLQKRLCRFGLLYGSLRFRKPYVKQSGQQFARLTGGHLVQYKRLADGSVVKV